MAKWPNAAVCKTAIHRFDSGRRLHISRTSSWRRRSCPEVRRRVSRRLRGHAGELQAQGAPALALALPNAGCDGAAHVGGPHEQGRAKLKAGLPAPLVLGRLDVPDGPTRDYRRARRCPREYLGIKPSNTRPSIHESGEGISPIRARCRTRPTLEIAPGSYRKEVVAKRDDRGDCSFSRGTVYKQQGLSGRQSPASRRNDDDAWLPLILRVIPAAVCASQSRAAGRTPPRGASSARRRTCRFNRSRTLGRGCNRGSRCCLPREHECRCACRLQTGEAAGASHDRHHDDYYERRS